MNGLLSPDDMMMAGPQGAYSGPRTAEDVLYGIGATGLLAGGAAMQQRQSDGGNAGLLEM